MSKAGTYTRYFRAGLRSERRQRVLRSLPGRGARRTEELVNIGLGRRVSKARRDCVTLVLCQVQNRM